MTRTDPRDLRLAHHRRVLYLIGLLPLVLAVAFFVKVLLMTHHDSAGIEAWDQRDGAVALEEYSANRSFNILERWLAPYDSGDAAFLLTDYPRARTLYTEALATVPHEHECTVRINLALADEKIGDAAAEAGSHEEAVKAWKHGIAVLDAGDCPHHSGQGKLQSKDAATVKKRLEDKLKSSSRQQSKPKNDKDRQQQQPSPEEKDKLKKLQEKNRQGRDDRDRSRDDRDYGDFGYDYQW